ncbi:MAG TPA: esterase-like activity of phytase family protein [Candidatus Sulfotelmatobacter sp.]|nr:esterase-like activity of phytase family protein [Candidatus Sulfotelmatobacter sp.]
MKHSVVRMLCFAFVLSLFPASSAHAQITLLAIGNLTGSRAGSYTDLSHLNYTLENGVAANYLGGLGSAITYAGGKTFLALPDRGPNAVPFDSNIDDTVSYINRFHTITMDLRPNKAAGLPYSLTPTLRATNLLWSLTPLTYGSGDAIVGSGVPPLNHFFFHFFTGRSDNFDPSQNSGDPNHARFDTEGIRVSNDGLSVFVSDEYGPYVYQFDRLTGVRVRSFHLPDSFYVTTLSSQGAVEISGNTSGRVANKGMEGLAITPDGKTLVGIMQNALIQDAAAGGNAKNLLRIVTIDIASGSVTHQYGYLLTAGSGVSEILALNNREFLVDERDGKGRGDGSNAKIKQLFKIDLSNAVDISNTDGLTASSNTVSKTLFLDLVPLLTSNGIAASNVPAKIEGISFGADVKQGKTTFHTLWIANDNDFLQTVSDPNGNPIDNPNQFFVVGFTDADLAGSAYVPQRPRPLDE